jgi:hypothetical protein
MKNLLLICLLVSYQFSFSQTKEIEMVDLFNKTIQNPVFGNQNNSQSKLFKKIIFIDNALYENNNENKFSFNSKSLNSSNTPKEIISIKSKEKDSDNFNLTNDLKKKFIYEIIAKELLQLNEQQNVAHNYGDRNIELYRNYELIQNKLIKSIKLNSEIEVQLGNSLMPFIKKIYKSEIDKTLNNSLNLLAFNF